MAKKAGGLTHAEIIQSIKKGQFEPIYFLMGDEPYFIDQITDAIIEAALSPEERDFNETILYGNETSMEFVINTARQYPTFAERRLVVVKEAKGIKNLEYLESYVKEYLPSTILVIAYKYGKLDKRSATAKGIDAVGVLFESSKMYDNKLPDWISTLAQIKGCRIDPKAAALLAEFVGNDLSRLAGEVDKLIVTLPAQTRQINVDLVERNIGISKEYNVFELISALSRKEVARANLIVNFFIKNPENPIPKSLYSLHAHFLKLFQVCYLPDKSDDSLKRHFGFNYFQLQDVKSALRNYSAVKILGILEAIRTTDAKFKGIDKGSTTDGDLLKELVFFILH